MSVSDVLRSYARHDAERRSALMVALLEGAAADWDADGPVRPVLSPYADDPSGAALPLRFAAALHRLVLLGLAPELAAHYRTVGGTAPPSQAWPAARRAVAAHGEQLRDLTGKPCQTNEVGRAVPLVIGLAEVARRTGRQLRLLEIGASAGLNLLADRFRYGQAYGPADSPCQLPEPGAAVGPGLRIAARAGCDLAPLDPTNEEGRLRLRASVWGDQPGRLARLDGALVLAAQERVPVEQASAADWLARRLADQCPEDLSTVVWHSIVRTYVDASQWSRVEELARRPGVWRLSYEPDHDAARGIALRLHGPGADPSGDLLAYGSGHGPPLTFP